MLFSMSSCGFPQLPNISAVLSVELHPAVSQLCPGQKQIIGKVMNNNINVTLNITL